jgi:quercetin dioxygenase-like cupin family protein
VAPGGSFGWHSHPGPSIIVVKSGTMTFYDGDDPSCAPEVVTTGQAVVDAGGTHVHVGRNEGTVDAVVIVTRLLPAGAAARVDQPDPGNCAF